MPERRDNRSEAPRRNDRGVSLLGVIAGAAGAAAAVTAVGVAASAHFAKSVVTPPRRRPEDVAVEAVWADEEGLLITLRATPDSRLGGEPGWYSFWFNQDQGHAVIGEIVDQTWDSITRRVIRVDFGVLDGTVRRGRVSGWVWLNPESAGFEARNVLVEGPLGPNPAWVVSAPEPSTDWVIHVHGRASARPEVLRGLRVVQDAGANSLVVSYRNDGEGTPSTDSRYSLGLTEWEDVEAAIDYAIAQGARRIVLFGWSMGGAIALQTLSRTARTRRIAGLVLDSPVVDWGDALTYQADASRVPTSVRQFALTLLGRSWGRVATGLEEPIDLESLNWVARAGEIRRPILVLHSDDDGFVPSGPSRELAAARPDLVTFVPFKTARHCKLWNHDQVLWESSIATWLAQTFKR